MLTLQDIFGFFGSQAETARILGISCQAISQWGGLVPELRAYQIETLSDGQLKVDKMPIRYRKK